MVAHKILILLCRNDLLRGMLISHELERSEGMAPSSHKCGGIFPGSTEGLPVPDMGGASGGIGA